MRDQSFFWHDYETFGVDPKLDGVAQFAGIRTDMDLNIIGDPVDIICRTTLDRLPHPEACMVTGISPLRNRSKGMTEVSFFQAVEKELGKKGTCGVGYNNINFDDEVTRNGLYRNFNDPYAREWKDGCSRWDLLNVLRIVDALRPNTFVVPLDPETGNKVFRLEKLSEANGIEHENAHDALADVIATIEMAKIVKEKEPELFDILFKQRTKNGIKDAFFKNGSFIEKPVIMAESFFGGDQRFVDVLFPIGSKDTDVYCIKLTKPLDRLFQLTAEELKEDLYKKKEDMAEGVERLPLHSFKINKCPVLLPLSYVNKEIAEDLSIPSQICHENLALIKANLDVLRSKIKTVFLSSYEKDPTLDVDQQIYNGFFSQGAKNEFEIIKKTQAVYLQDYLEKTKFSDPRIEEMLFRYIGRNYEDSFNQEGLDKWNSFCKKRIEDGVYSLTFEQYFEKIEEFKEVYKDDERRMKTLNDMTIFGEKTKKKLSLKS